MSRKTTIYAAAVMATLALAAGYNEISLAQAPAQAPAAQAPRQGRGGNAGDSAAPARKQGDGVGPFKKMVIRSVTLIDGTGGPPLSPMDIVIEGNRITSVRQAGWPGLPQQAESRAARCRLRDRRQGHVRDARLRRHARARRRQGQGAGPELLLQAVAGARRHHGPRRVAVVGRGEQLGEEPLGEERDRRAAHLQLPDARLGLVRTGRCTTPEKAREWVRWAAANNIDGIKFFNRGDETPEIDTAAIDEAHKNKMGTVAHLSQNNVAMFNARIAGDAHLDTVTHYYGHFESLLKDKTIQEYPDRLRLQQRAGSLRRHRPHLEPDLRARLASSGSSTSSTRRRTTSPSIRRSTSTPRHAT